MFRYLIVQILGWTIATLLLFVVVLILASCMILIPFSIVKGYFDYALMRDTLGVSVGVTLLFIFCAMLDRLSKTIKKVNND